MLSLASGAKRREAKSNEQPGPDKRPRRGNSFLNLFSLVRGGVASQPICTWRLCCCQTVGIGCARQRTARRQRACPAKNSFALADDDPGRVRGEEYCKQVAVKASDCACRCRFSRVASRESGPGVAARRGWKSPGRVGSSRAAGGERRVTELVRAWLRSLAASRVESSRAGRTHRLADPAVRSRGDVALCNRRTNVRSFRLRAS